KESSVPFFSNSASRACTVLRDRPIRWARALVVARGSSAKHRRIRASVASTWFSLRTMLTFCRCSRAGAEHTARLNTYNLCIELQYAALSCSACTVSRASSCTGLRRGVADMVRGHEPRGYDDVLTLVVRAAARTRLRSVMTTTTEMSRQYLPAHSAALAEIEQRVLWLSTAIVDYANRVRPNPPGLKVGGHQASCASMVSLMTSLWFRHLRPQDRVSVKPHASPVLHAINYLLGGLDESYLTELRAFGGLQGYPSRSKDPDQVDYSTGSVGIGATAPIWVTLARRYVNTVAEGAGSGRQYTLVGDAELDEGAVWEAVLDPTVAELGELVWIVDVNRQSLDRVVPGIAAERLQGMFTAAGWQ